MTSRRTRSGSVLFASSSASAALPATCGSKLSRLSASDSGTVIDSSSSTSRMLRRPNCIDAGSLPSCGSVQTEEAARIIRAAVCSVARKPVSPCDEASPHALLGVVAHAAPERVADALLEPGGDGRTARPGEHAALERLATAADDEVMRVVRGVTDDEPDDARLRLGGELDPVAQLRHPDRLCGRCRQAGLADDACREDRERRGGENRESLHCDPFRGWVC